MSSLIDSILGENAQTDQLSQELLLFVKFLKTESAEHMKRVIKTLPEFDLHDQSHSEKVEENMSLLIGESLLRKLSSVDLFLLSASAHLHDCGMAPADWELKALDVVAKATDRRFDVLKDNINYIKDNKAQIFGRQESEASNWLFSPSNEKELFKQLANEMKACQEYLDGYSISETNDKDDKDAGQILKDRRVDYIRRTHHERSERYIKNMEKEFCGKLESAPGKQLADILAGICRAHGEDLSYTSSELKLSITISAKYKVNPQFVAMMLRLGDIIHFSKDRAPFVLRNATQFKSDYSHYQWELKEGGVNYQIVDGKVIYTAYCEEPKLYYGLLEYTDWIKREIANFNELKRNWSKEYKDVCVDEVNTSDITYDSNKFIPAPGKKFTLSQNKIIELLMGVQLYKDPYACIRELYQNALDAVRCNIDKNKSLSKDIKGLIEFGLETDERGKYLYCLDNGVGMSQLVIENYLLNIGNSYYKSQDFFRLQHKWNSSFTPTSQFGIGILSCFMIGDAMEIITKTDNDKEPRIICIDGPLELVYYKPASSEDAELIHSSGTMVKIYLQEGFANNLTNSYPTHTDLYYFLYWVMPIYREGFGEKTLPTIHDLYINVDKFIFRVPDNIKVQVRFQKDFALLIKPKPYQLDLNAICKDLQDEQLLTEMFTKLQYNPHQNQIKSWKKTLLELDQESDNLIYNYIEVKHGDIEFIAPIYFPTKELNNIRSSVWHEKFLLYPFVTHNTSFCVDGICTAIDNTMNIDFYTRILSQLGVINFVGRWKPQLSVDRSHILSFSPKTTMNTKNILNKYFEAFVAHLKSHIAPTFSNSGKSIIPNSIFEYIFPSVRSYETFVVWLLSEKESDFIWPPLCDAIGENLSIHSFLEKDQTYIHNYDYFSTEKLTKSLLFSKLLYVKNVFFRDNLILMKGHFKIQNQEDNSKFRQTLFRNFVVRTTYKTKVFEEFDVNSKVFPFISDRLFYLLPNLEFEEGGIVQRVKKSNNDNILELDLNSLIIKVLSKKPHEYFYFFETGYYDENSIKPIFPTKIRTNELNRQKVLMIYIAPKVLSEEDKYFLEDFEDVDPDNHRGIQEGWSLLLTGMDEENIKILPGLRSRKELVETISDYFWEIYSEYTFEFTDGKNLRDYKI